MITLSLSLLSFIVFDYDPGDDLECGSVLSQFWKGIEASPDEGQSRSTGNVFGHRRTRTGDRLEKSFNPYFFFLFFPSSHYGRAKGDTLLYLFFSTVDRKTLLDT